MVDTVDQPTGAGFRELDAPRLRKCGWLALLSLFRGLVHVLLFAWFFSGHD